MATSALILTATFLKADSVDVTLTAAGPANDGVDYVLPYELSINGLLTPADCYDFFDEVTVGEQWQANELTLSEAAQFGAFSGAAYDNGSTALDNYEEVAWLSSQPTSTEQNQIDLQHAIWNIFDPGAFAVTSGMQTYLTGWQSALNTGLDPSWFDDYLFVEATSGAPGDGTFPQTFVIETGSGQNNSSPTTPEPGSIVLLSIGVALLWIGARRPSHLRRAALAVAGKPALLSSNLNGQTVD